MASTHSSLGIPRTKTAPIEMMRRPGISHAWISVFGWTCLLIFVLLLGAFFFSQTNPGRHMLEKVLESSISNAIPGGMRIGELESVGFLRPRVRDLDFEDPYGRKVLHLNHASIDFDFSDIVRSRVGFHRARVNGGLLLITEQPDGRTSIEAAFSAPKGQKKDKAKDNKKDKEKDRPLKLQLDNILVEGLTIRLQFGSDQVFRIRRVKGFVKIWQESTPGIRVQMSRISGVVDGHKVLGSPMELIRVDGWVHGNEPHVLDLDLHVKIGRSRLTGHLAYFNRKKTPVVVELRPQKGMEAFLASFGMAARSLLSDKVRIHVSGP